jgi:hypothetical protein
MRATQFGERCKPVAPEMKKLFFNSELEVMFTEKCYPSEQKLGRMIANVVV